MPSRLEVEDEVDHPSVCPISSVNVSLAGGSSPPYIGDELGFRVTRRLHEYPYDIIYGTIRLEPDHHGAVEETPDRKYCS